jgi:hypothetical protein
VPLTSRPHQAGSGTYIPVNHLETTHFYMERILGFQKPNFTFL